jgi:hypothetical protein
VKTDLLINIQEVQLLRELGQQHAVRPHLSQQRVHAWLAHGARDDEIRERPYGLF